MNTVRLVCDYCGFEGVYPDEVEIRAVEVGERERVAETRQACVDRAACDKRDAERANDNERTDA